MKEDIMTRQIAERLKQKVRERSKPVKAREAIGALHGSEQERKLEVKTLSLTFAPRQKPDVIFTGSWNGRLVRAAFNAISKAYRHRRYKNIRLGENKTKRPDTKGEHVKPKEVSGDDGKS